MIGWRSVPDPFGQSCPVQVEPDLNKMRSPGEKTVALTLASVFHAVDKEVPLSSSLPDVEST
jgi:hypothetical protein